MVIRIIKYYVILSVIFFSWVTFVSANVVINEVQVSPTGERFIELYSSDSSQSLTGWSIKRKSLSGTEYSLVSASRLEGKSFSGSNYFLLVNENDYTGSITPDAIWAKSNSFSNDNTILLFNSNGDLVNKVGYGEASDCDGDCPANPGADKSLQRSSSTSWMISSPTPGEENQSTESEVSENQTETDTTDNTNQNDSSSDKDTTTEILKITTKIISPKIITAGIPFSFSSSTTTNRGETYIVGKFVWNFGDGMVSEKWDSNPFEYVYEYPGEYVVNLSYFGGVFSKTADATSKITIKVIPAEISISSVGEDKNPFVEIENKSNYEIILSDWVITGGIHYFTIPEGTTLLPNKKIKLSPKITGFVGEDIKSVFITNPNKEIMATYPAVNIKKVIQKISSTGSASYNKTTSSNSTNDSFENGSQVINLNDLEASAEGSGVNISSSTYSWLGLLVIIGLGVASFLLIKKRNSVDDYVEKEIRAEDMTIVE